MTIEELKNLARKLRKDVITMSYRAHIGHVGPCLSMADLMTVIYHRIMNIDPKKPLALCRDRFILSKGHASAALYATLAEKGFFDKKILETFIQDGGNLPGHPEIQCVPGVEVTTGSLGHGLSMGCGMAMASKIDGAKWKVFVLLSDGECDEGTVWETALAASHFKLDKLIAVIDYNKFQALGRTNQVMNLEPLKAKWESFGWAVREIDGHDVEEIVSTLESAPFFSGKPSMVIAHTVMGKGVSFMEDKLEWHYLDPKKEHYEQAMKELGG